MLDSKKTLALLCTVKIVNHLLKNHHDIVEDVKSAFLDLIIIVDG